MATVNELSKVFSGSDPTVSGVILEGLRKEMGLNQAEFARLVGLSARTVAAWEGGMNLKESSFRNIVQIGRLYSHLRKVFPDDSTLGTWLRTPNSAFEGKKPLEVIERGQIDLVWRMVYRLESGEPG